MKATDRCQNLFLRPMRPTVKVDAVLSMRVRYMARDNAISSDGRCAVGLSVKVVTGG